eukprot:CAMPEP_0176252174 /NCGR_PEP_ID=MMETSP0121_2-20121125/35375_1 /TAXON_ID=160619 /ORGANISM="Kryptoperidinium foliaceum, Strain CCMP 1326" /LENGTH=53 /DNA_ID=CAMNT_0017591933 /DNA_START=621 /DNA_END=779 /DNA_ORIENTATION=-
MAKPWRHAAGGSRHRKPRTGDGQARHSAAHAGLRYDDALHDRGLQQRRCATRD